MSILNTVTTYYDYTCNIRWKAISWYQVTEEIHTRSHESTDQDHGVIFDLWSTSLIR